MKLGCVLIALIAASAAAQGPGPEQQAPAPAAPVYRVTVVSRTLTAINYHHRTGTTPIDFRGTDLMPGARGHANVDSKMGSTKIDTWVEKLAAPDSFGPEFLTYVLWAVTPEGRARNLGELVPNSEGNAKLLSTTDFQAFGLIVTAEPYFAVTEPSDAVVLENAVSGDTAGTIEQVDTRYRLLQRGSYTAHLADYRPIHIDPKGPLQVAEAENAVEISRLSGAEEYAPDTLQRAVVDMQNAEAFVSRGDRKPAETDAREAAQTAEDARIISLRAAQDADAARLQAEAEQREADAREQANVEAQRRAAAEADRASAEAAGQQALESQRRAEQEKDAAEAARDQALAQQQAAQTEASQAEADRTNLRMQLEQQLNAVLETRETATGLIVNMPDLLFATGSDELRPDARLRLARVAGIVASHPGLRLEVNGYTDSTGTATHNERLAERRAESVRDFLTSQGVSRESVAAQGFGEADPIASNDTASGRRRNRRVEIVVSGDIITAQRSSR